MQGRMSFIRRLYGFSHPRLRPFHSVPTRLQVLAGPFAQYPRFSLYLLQFVLVLHLTSKYLGYVAFTIGPSMLPTLSAKGDGVLVSTMHRRGRGIKVGDCVDFEHPMVPGVGAIKRVIGMPGDFVERNVAAVEMGPEGLLSKKTGMMMQVPEGHCWLLGDNLPDSRDSRTYGPLPLALIKGKVVARVWPATEVKWIENALQPPI